MKEEVLYKVLCNRQIVLMSQTLERVSMQFPTRMNGISLLPKRALTKIHAGAFLLSGTEITKTLPKFLEEYY